MNGDSSSPLPPADKAEPVVRPVTLSDMVAFLAYAQNDIELPYFRAPEDTAVFIETLDEVLRRLTGVAS